MAKWNPADVMTDQEPLALVTELIDSVAVITLNRADKKNALSIALRDEVSVAFERLARDKACKVIVLTGAGDFFSAGFDLKEFAGDDAHKARLWASSDRYHRAILECPIATIAAVNGPALAGGFDTAVLCDIRIAATTAHFAHPEQAWADVVYAPLHDLVGGAIAHGIAKAPREVLMRNKAKMLARAGIAFRTTLEL